MRRAELYLYIYLAVLEHGDDQDRDHVPGRLDLGVPVFPWAYDRSEMRHATLRGIGLPRFYSVSLCYH
jgi:hypothetical protein